MYEIKDLTFSYDKKNEALNDVSFSVNDGEWLSILGHNGSGKSTLAKLLIGLLEPTKGSIFYNGIEIKEDTIKELRKNVGIVFQNPDNQFVGYNVKYDIAFGLENHNIPRTEMIDLINEYTEKVGMKDFLEREPQTLSGGQKQRVAIAGILALNCETIILDEATSMLDPEGVEDIIELIDELHNKYNKTVITITHDLNLAQKSDRCLVFRKGEIIAEGKPEDIFKMGDMLRSSNLDMPFPLKAYDLASKDDVLKNDERLINALWEYHLKM